MYRKKSGKFCGYEIKKTQIIREASYFLIETRLDPLLNTIVWVGIHTTKSTNIWKKMDVSQIKTFNFNSFKENYQYRLNEINKLQL